MMKISVKSEVFFIVLLVVVAAVFLFCLETAIPNFFLTGDNSSYFLPSYIHNWRAVVEEKTIPLITWHQFLGQTYLGQGQNSVLYPPVYAAVFLSKVLFGNVYSTIDILAVAHLLVGVAGMYCLLRRLKVSVNISFLGSLVWITAPFIVGLTKEWLNVAYVAAYLPFNFLLLEKLIARPKMRCVWGLALLKMFMFLQGYVQWEFLMIQFEVLYVVLTMFGQWRKQGRDAVKRFLYKYVLSFVFLFFLIAPLFFPMLYAQQVSRTRNEVMPFFWFMYGAVSLIELLRVQIFDFIPNVYFRWSSYIYYVGPFGLALLMLVPLKKSVLGALRRRRINIYAVLAIAALLLSTWLNAVLYIIPVLNLFKGPPKYFLFFVFFAAIVVAGVVNSLAKGVRRNGKYALLVLMMLIVVLNMLVMWQNKSLGTYRWEWRKVEFNISEGKIDNPPQVGVIDHMDKSEGRIFTYGLCITEKCLLYNYATMFGLYHFGGYDSLVSKLNSELTGGLPYTNTYLGDFTSETLDYISLWSVRYIITTDVIEKHVEQLRKYPQLKEIYREDGVLMYENTRSRPFVYESEDVERAVPFEFGVNHINAYPEKEGDHKLIFSIAPLPLFYYYFDGERAGRITSQVGPVEVDVPAGTEKVTIRYIDYPFIVGVSLFSGFLLVVAGYYWAKRKKAPRENHLFN